MKHKYKTISRLDGMTVKNGRIVEATEDALFKMYLLREMDEVMPFDEYLEKMKKRGVKVV